jgi:hypothetical protein
VTTPCFKFFFRLEISTEGKQIPVKYTLKFQLATQSQIKLYLGDRLRLACSGYVTNIL